MAKIQFKHGRSGAHDAVYRAWKNMKQRCLNPDNHSFARYGGRGITVCDRWNDFTPFLEDMGARPEGMSIERIDNSLGYFKENCIWANKITQANNTRRNVFVDVDGERFTLSQLARKTGINAKTLRMRFIVDPTSALIPVNLKTGKPLEVTA